MYHACVCAICVQLIRVIKLCGRSEAELRAMASQSTREGQPAELSLTCNGEGDQQEMKSNYTVIDTIFDDFCDGCRSQERAERSVHTSL